MAKPTAPMPGSDLVVDGSRDGTGVDHQWPLREAVRSFGCVRAACSSSVRAARQAASSAVAPVTEGGPPPGASHSTYCWRAVPAGVDHQLAAGGVVTASDTGSKASRTLR